MTPLLIKYPQDLTGRNPDNRVSGEPHTLVENTDGTARAFAPNYGAFYTSTMTLRDSNGIELIPYVDYIATYLHEELTSKSGLEVCGVVVVINPNVTSSVTLSYQVVGGEYSISVDALEQVLETLGNNEGPIQWGAITGKPGEYVPGGHLHALWELYGFEYLITQLERVNQAILVGDQATFDEIRAYAYKLYEDGKTYTDALDSRFQDHKADKTNPHDVTKAQVGLGSVQNYGIASEVEAELGTRTDRYMTPQRVAQAIVTQVGNRLDNHIANVSNPHSVTKAQVGLGSVQNYGIANQLIAEAGTRHDLYMTPLRTAEAITSQVGTAFNLHVNNTGNPHSVTKAQVGLGSVQNYPIATQVESEQGIRNDRYLTPERGMQAITHQVGNRLDNHIANVSNPHSVTKAQVGLGSVQNYPISDEAEARNGNSNIRYMTPIRVAQAITTQIGVSFSNHVNNKTNPHDVTKAQVGLSSVENYGIATITEARNGTVNTKYMTPLRTAEAITQQVGSSLNTHITATNNPHNVTKAQVGLWNVENYRIAEIAEAQSGTANNVYMTPLRTANAISTQAGNLVSSHAGLTNNPHSVTKAQVGLGSVANYRIAEIAEAQSGTANNVYMTPLRTANAISTQAGALVSSHANLTNNPHNVTSGQVGLGSVANYRIAWASEARDGTANNVYMTPLRTAEAISTQAGNLVSGHAGLTNNPHNVNKAQVGLGSVANYGIASLTEARDGTANNVYMTPLRTANAIATQAGNLVSGHAGLTNNPHSVNKAQVGLGSVENYGVATYGEARDGTVNTKYMTPLRTRDAFGPAFDNYVTNGFSMPRTTNLSRFDFGDERSGDKGWIEHYEFNEFRRMRFCAGENGTSENDSNHQFSWGSSTSVGWRDMADLTHTRLLVQGDLRGLSDARVKKNFRGWDDPLAMLSKMRGGVYDRTDIEMTQVGVIAQEMMKVLPEVVGYDEKEDQYSVSYGNLTAFLIETCKALLSRVEALEGGV